MPRATPKPLKAKAKAKADVKRKARSPVKPKPRTKPRSKAAAKPKVKDTGPEVPAAPQVDPIVERPADERLKYLVAALMRRAGRLEEQLPDGAKKSLVGRLRRRLVLEAGSSNPKTALERVRQIGNEISELEKP